jgi:biotin carboxyl carrier protein
MKTINVQVAQQRYTITMSGRREDLRINGRAIDCELQKDTKSYNLLRIGNKYLNVFCQRKTDNSFELWINHHVLSIQLEDTRSLLLSQFTNILKGSEAQYTVKAPMPGLVTAIEVVVGDIVAPGKGLVILEAMKMENEIRAVQAGRIKSIAVTTKAIVEKDQILMIIDSV